ncbi:hypothetical protein EJB05_49543, partial [Eragrostis curvula]
MVLTLQAGLGEDVAAAALTATKAKAGSIRVQAVRGHAKKWEMPIRNGKGTRKITIKRAIMYVVSWMSMMPIGELLTPEPSWLTTMLIPRNQRLLISISFQWGSMEFKRLL